MLESLSINCGWFVKPDDVDEETWILGWTIIAMALWFLCAADYIEEITKS